MTASDDRYPRVLEAFLNLTTQEMSPEQKQLIWIALTEPGRARQIMGWLVNMAVMVSGSKGKHQGGK